MATPHSAAGDVNRDLIELAGYRISEAERVLVDVLITGESDPKKLIKAIGIALRSLREARESNTQSQAIIVAARRRSKKETA